MKHQLRYKDGNTLSYADYGDENGFPILVQHGLVASIDDYGLFDCLIRAHARLICIARPGYGGSSPYVLNSFAEWADLVSLIVDELKLTQFDLLGMSSGAPYSYSIGNRFPEKARNIYILSGIPALYDEIVLSEWPYKMARNARLAEMQALARELFFSNVTDEDLKQPDVRDSLMNDCFGVAQDLRLRTLDWGFRLSDVKEKVFMRHSKCDDSVPFRTAVRTADLLPNCTIELTETGPHFSSELLDHFMEKTIIPNI